MVTIAVDVNASDLHDPFVRKAVDALTDYSRRLFPGSTSAPIYDLRVTLALCRTEFADIIARTGAVALVDGEYAIVTEHSGPSQHIWIVGADGVACLTGVYKLLGELGCSFNFHGDLLPPPTDKIPLIEIAQRFTPRFALRGTQLWCYWYSGRDVWDFETYRRYLDQFPKLGLNLFDFPLYFYEPLYTGYAVGDLRPSGYFLSGRTLDSVRVGRSEFQSAPAHFTSADIPRYGSEAERSDAAIALMRRVFDYAKSLGIKTCVGIEVANQLDFARDVANALPVEDRYENGRLIQPSSPSARQVLTARLQALFDAYPDCDYYALWQSEAGVFRTTAGSPHPDDLVSREQLCAIHSSLKPSDAGYICWLRLADEIVADMKPDARLVTSGWGSEAVFACADEILGDRFICSSIAPYEPKLALASGGLDFYAHTKKEKWNVTWAETDQHMWVMQPKLDATQKVVDRLESDDVSAIMALHWNTLFCDINLSFYASQCWSPCPDPASFRQAWAKKLYGSKSAASVVATFAALERLNDLTIESDPTMQSWVGYECFINPLLQAYRFIDISNPFPEKWIATYVMPHLTYGDKFLATLDDAVAHSDAAAALAEPRFAQEAERLFYRVRHVRGLYAAHIKLAEVMQCWNDAVGGPPDVRHHDMGKALQTLDAIEVEPTLHDFIAGLAPVNGPPDLGELGLLLSLNEKFLGGVARLRGRMKRAIESALPSFRQHGDGALMAIWPAMRIGSVSLLARDDPHAPADAPAAGLPHTPGMDLIQGSQKWKVELNEGVTAQRFSAELGFWRHLDQISIVITAPGFYDPVLVRIYLAQDADWDSLFRRQSITVNGTLLGQYDDFLCRGDDMSEGYWVEAPAQFIDGQLKIDVARKGNSDVLIAGVVVIGRERNWK